MEGGGGLWLLKENCQHLHCISRLCFLFLSIGKFFLRIPCPIQTARRDRREGLCSLREQSEASWSGSLTQGKRGSGQSTPRLGALPF